MFLILKLFACDIILANHNSTVATTQNHYIKTASPDAIAAMKQFSDKLVQTKSMADTLAAINSISPYYAPYKKFTSYSAIEAAFRLNATHLANDAELADRLRLVLASLIVRS